MATFDYQDSMASAEHAPASVRGTQDFETDLPMMEHNMEQEFTQYPWEATMPDFTPNESVVVVPERMSIVAVTHQRAQVIARDYVESVSERIPEEDAREGFVRGAGMFDFPAPDADLDDLLG